MRQTISKKIVSICLIIIFLVPGISILQSAQAGKYPYPELLPSISYEVVEILRKYGMPVQHEREDPWLKVDGIPGNYAIYFYQADEIPQAAKIETIKFCMDLYEKGGKKENFTIVMYQEKFEASLGLFSRLKPFFKLTLKGKD